MPFRKNLSQLPIDPYRRKIFQPPYFWNRRHKTFSAHANKETESHSGWCGGVESQRFQGFLLRIVRKLTLQQVLSNSRLYGESTSKGVRIERWLLLDFDLCLERFFVAHFLFSECRA